MTTSAETDGGNADDDERDADHVHRREAFAEPLHAENNRQYRLLRIVRNCRCQLSDLVSAERRGGVRRDRPKEPPMKYMMFVCTDTEPDPPTGDPKLDDVDDWVERHDASGARVMGDALRPTADATTVRVRGGKVLVTDGPFAESREWIAGFDILKCADLDAAIEIASQHPMARFGRLELRPFWEDESGGPTS